MVKVIPSKDPPEVFNKRLEEAVKRFYIAIQKEQTKKAPSANQSRERLTVDF